jgi:hypothetical protein
MSGLEVSLDLSERVTPDHLVDLRHLAAGGKPLHQDMTETPAQFDVVCLGVC